MPTALITGITGQDGSYLAELLLAKGYRVVGIVRRSSTTPYERIAHLVDRVELVSADLLDQTSLIDVVADRKPRRDLQPRGAELRADVVDAAGAHRRVHRARRDAHARGDEEGGARRRASTRPARARCSARCVETPQRETTPFYPRSPVRRRQGLRPLDHRELPRELRAVRGVRDPVQPREPAARPRVRDAQGHRRRRRASSSGSRPKLRLGNLDARRDWGFAGDYVDAMWRMLQQDEPDDYVIGTGHTWSVRELCDAAFGAVGLDYREYVKQDPRFFRPAEVDLLVADPSKARAQLGWAPTVAFDELVRMMVDADLARHAARR